MAKFGAWLPDLSDFNNPGVIEARNVIPVIDGYRQYRSLNATTSALNSACKGAFSAQSSSRNNFSYAGSGSKLYQISGTDWVDQSKASGTYAVLEGDSWEFLKWGETVIAVGGINASTPVPPQVITMGATGSTEFADLGGSPPQTRHAAVVRDFVVLGNIYEDATDYPSRLRWSGINSSTTWGTDPQTQSDYNDLAGEGGWIRGIRGGEYGVIFQERSIWKMDYIGPPVIFAFNETLPGVGTSCPNSLVQYGDDIYFLGQTGFKLVRNGEEKVDIGKDMVDRWIYANLDQNFLANVVGAFDRRNKRIVWIFPSLDASDGGGDSGVVFDLNTGKWSHFNDAVTWVWDAFGEDYTLEGLTAVSASLDALPFSLDSPAWVGGEIVLNGFSDLHKSGGFDGVPLTAEIKTAENRITPLRTLVGRALVDVDNPAGQLTVACGYRDDQKDPVVWTASQTAERDGTYTFRVDAKYHRFKIAVQDGFEHAHGLSLPDHRPSSEY